MILTDEKGKPFERPKREDFASAVEFVRAVHAFNDRVASCANSAFAIAFRGAT